MNVIAAKIQKDPESFILSTGSAGVISLINIVLHWCLNWKNFESPAHVEVFINEDCRICIMHDGFAEFEIATEKEWRRFVETQFIGSNLDELEIQTAIQDPSGVKMTPIVVCALSSIFDFEMHRNGLRYTFRLEDGALKSAITESADEKLSKMVISFCPLAGLFQYESFEMGEMLRVILRWTAHLCSGTKFSLTHKISKLEEEFCFENGSWSYLTDRCSSLDKISSIFGEDFVSDETCVEFSAQWLFPFSESFGHSQLHCFIDLVEIESGSPEHLLIEQSITAVVNDVLVKELYPASAQHDFKKLLRNFLAGVVNIRGASLRRAKLDKASTVIMETSRKWAQSNLEDLKRIDEVLRAFSQ
ncbi:MAG: hypothetical protein C0507_25480 [Cyanobacteria bacterium PR.3.49]|nr:hypothetical protein [Cyanobacteria bacterium PR.3.49]